MYTVKQGEQCICRKFFEAKRCRKVEEFRKKFRDYAECIKKIRILSAPDTEKISSGEEYYAVMQKNLEEIGLMSEENRKLLKDVIEPILSHRESLSPEERKMIPIIEEVLMDPDSNTDVDGHLTKMLTDILLSDVYEEDYPIDEDTCVIMMANAVKRDYQIISRVSSFSNGDVTDIRSKAVANCEALSVYLGKDIFPTLGDKAKAAVLTFTLMQALLYENDVYATPESYWEPAVSVIERSIAIAHDPFYKEALPDYDFETLEFRAFYYGSFLAYSILPESVAKKAYSYTERALAFLSECSSESILANVNMEQERELLYLASVQARYTSARDACELFYRDYTRRDPCDISVAGMDRNMDTPSSYLCISKMMDMELTEEDHRRYGEILHSTLAYLRRCPKSSFMYMKCITLFTNLLNYFREVPDAMTFDTFCMNAFAVMHPSTYVHSKMVAQLSECMVRHLLEKRPELFADLPGCGSVDRVKQEADRIIGYTYHSALCHDIGKLFMIDTVAMYGRGLLDDEFSILKKHPVVGAMMAAEHPSTKDFADVIECHHQWYDCSRGYPMKRDSRSSPYKTIIDIVTTADCLDAATDTGGRSYKRGKDIEEFGEELRETAGTRYAPFMAELFEDTVFKKDVGDILLNGRKRLYAEVYEKLKTEFGA